jgi:hypothetical protein
MLNLGLQNYGTRSSKNTKLLFRYSLTESKIITWWLSNTYLCIYQFDGDKFNELMSQVFRDHKCTYILHINTVCSQAITYMVTVENSVAHLINLM